ncbi:tabersonine 6,7-epoxidase-like [Actinidia eriantha]|uniref:tabersonine 6,7-epoxidase-like n=1 Tax=Actinidia eriantha TaxID=165200 RepID=UPI002587FC95|nr:tabersonine 6,7-epoxidase-like [Actinidia eriantha]
MHQLVGSLIHRNLRDLAKTNGPMMHLQLDELSIVVVSSLEMAIQIMKTHDMQENFLTCGVTARAAFGEKSKHQEAFLSVVEECTAYASGFNIAYMYPSIKLLETIAGERTTFEKMHKRMDKILEPIITEHIDRRRTTEASTGEAEDLVDILLRIQKHGDLEFPLTNDNIKADIFSAVTEASTAAVEWAISEIENSEIYEISGYEILAKIRVIVNAWAIGRDPIHWNQAEEFDPERFLNNRIDFKGDEFEYIPFDAGRRICPGISFALPNVELPLAQLLYCFDWKLPSGKGQQELDITEAFGLSVRRKYDLNLIPIVYPLFSVE